MRALLQFACVIAFVAGPTPVFADTIFLLSSPDLMASGLSVTYNSTTHEFTADGYADALTTKVAGVPTTFGIDTGVFSLTAQISNTGVASGGVLTVSGCLSGMAGQPGCQPGALLLHTLSLNYFSFSNVADSELAFGFSTMSGDLQSIFGSIVFLKMNLFGFPGSFASDFFTDDFSNVADLGINAAGAIPEPGTWALMASGLVLILVGSSRRNEPARAADSRGNPA